MALLDQAWALYLEKRYGEAEAIVTHWLANIPVDARARAMLALICCKQGREQEARKNIKRAVDIDPTSDFVYISQAWIYCWCHDYYAAREALQNAMYVNPDHPDYPQLLDIIRHRPEVAHEVRRRQRYEIPVGCAVMLLALAFPGYLLLTGRIKMDDNFKLFLAIGLCLFGLVFNYFFRPPPRG